MHAVALIVIMHLLDAVPSFYTRYIQIEYRTGDNVPQH